MSWSFYLNFYVLGFLFTSLAAIASERKSTMRRMSQFDKANWSNIFFASAFWPIVIFLMVTLSIGGFIFSGKMRDILTKEVIPSREPVQDFESDTFRSAVRVRSVPTSVETAHREMFQNVLVSFPERPLGEDSFPERSLGEDERTPIHIIGIIPNKMVSSYQLSQNEQSYENNKS